MNRKLVTGVLFVFLMCLVAVIGVSIAQAADAPKRGGWEYKALHLGGGLGAGNAAQEAAARNVEAELNKLGADGWELVSADFGIYTLKKAK